jgi:hypothetical protein
VTDDEVLQRFLASQPTELEYLQSIEAQAKTVVAAAYDEWGIDAVLTESPDRPALMVAIGELARSVRRVHSVGDGCVPDDA